MAMCGMFVVLPQGQSIPSPLALTSVSVEVMIVDMVASVHVVQVFVNDLTESDGNAAPNIDANYIFPLPASAAVCSFSAEIAGRRIEGAVKEKEEARAEFNQAVQEGRNAALMESHTSDVFQTSVGNIPPNSTATVQITYITELEQDVDKESLRFVFPASIAPRYGESKFQHVGRSEHRLSIKVGCAMSSGAISTIASPSHTIQMFLGEAQAGSQSSKVDNRHARIELTSLEPSLDKDFVLTLSAANLDKPRCVIERGENQDFTAMLTLTPRFALKPIRSEIIFVVDRSGSMHGTKIAQTRSAMHLFLRSVPPRSYFNIIGFGNSLDALFLTSAEYTQETLKTATAHVDKMDANLGGTDIHLALTSAFTGRRKDMPSQIIILTDGEVWNVDQIVSLISKEVESGKESGNFARLFALGIGDQVSTALVSSMARAGEGYSQFCAEGERMEKKIVGMLRNCLMPPMSDYKIDWGIEEVAVQRNDDNEDFEMLDTDDTRKEPISLFSAEEPNDKHKEEDVQLPAQQFQQAPHQISPLFPGDRFIVLATVQGKNPPTTIKITGKTTDGPVELSVPAVPLESGLTSLGNGAKFGLLQTLAARKLIRDLEERRSYLHDVRTNPLAMKSGGPIPADIVRREIVRLGTTYRLVSSATSFVAVEVELNSDGKVPERKEVWIPGVIPKTDAGPSTLFTFGGIKPIGGRPPMNSGFATNFGPQSFQRSSNTLFGSAPATGGFQQQQKNYFGGGDASVKPPFSFGNHWAHGPSGGTFAAGARPAPIRGFATPMAAGPYQPRPPFGGFGTSQTSASHGLFGGAARFAPVSSTTASHGLFGGAANFGAPSTVTTSTFGFGGTSQSHGQFGGAATFGAPTPVSTTGASPAPTFTFGGARIPTEFGAAGNVAPAFDTGSRTPSFASTPSLSGNVVASSDVTSTSFGSVVSTTFGAVGGSGTSSASSTFGGSGSANNISSISFGSAEGYLQTTFAGSDVNAPTSTSVFGQPAGNASAAPNTFSMSSNFGGPPSGQDGGPGSTSLFNGAGSSTGSSVASPFGAFGAPPGTGFAFGSAPASTGFASGGALNPTSYEFSQPQPQLEQQLQQPQQMAAPQFGFGKPLFRADSAHLQQPIKELSRPELLTRLIRHQDFDGSFTESDELMNLLSAMRRPESDPANQKLTNAREKLRNSGLQERLWVTALVVAVLRCWARELAEEWILVADKALAYLSGDGIEAETRVEMAMLTL
ncbi:hypothetical protein BJ742DRAFT_808698 [Cladochytrium replicatum]|nr:hypothetical protein BJ742DRAFT_808698 [Cladochytrium replicatum]